MTIVQKLGTFKIVFLTLGLRKQPFRVNDKRNVLLLYLLDRQIQLQIAGDFFGAKIPSTLLDRGERGGVVDVVVLSTFWNTHIFRDW